MNTPDARPETIILLDDQKLYSHVVRTINSCRPSPWERLQKIIPRTSPGRKTPVTIGKAASAIGHSFAFSDTFTFKVTPLPPASTGFTQSHRFDINGQIVNFLYIKPANGHVFGWLTLATLHQNTSITRVLCISQALSLRDGIVAGDITLVTRASALPYPALYESRPPAWQTDARTAPRHAQHFYATEQSLSTGRTLLAASLPALAQTQPLEVQTGYPQHPTWNGSLIPWSPQQYNTLRAAGLDTMSEIPAAAYDFAQQHPDIPVICFNVVTAHATEGAAHTFLCQNTSVAKEWAIDAVNLMVKYIQNSYS